MKNHRSTQGFKAHLNHPLRILIRNTPISTTTRIPTTPRSRPRMHPHRRLIHIMIINDLTRQHRRPRLSLPKNRRRITPEITTIRRNTTRERILRSCDSLTLSLTQTISRRCEKCINSQQTRPLRETIAVAARGRRRSGEGWVWSCACSGKTGCVERGCSGCHC